MSRGGNISTKTRVSGSAGSITLHAKVLSLSDDSSVSSDASSNTSPNTSRGSGGQITVTATDVNLVDGSRIGNTNNSSLRPGAVTVQAEHLTLSNLSSIDSTALTASTGGSGNISVTAGTLRIHNNSNIRSETHSDIASSGEGNISIVTTGSIELNKGGGIRTNTYRRQDAGIITVRADNIYISEDFVAVNGETRLPSSISSNAGDAGLASQGISGSLIGNAGHVTVNARRIDLADGGTIQTESWGRGGGTITVHAAGHLVISGLSNTGIVSRARRHRTTGNGAIGDAGSITVKAGTVELRDGGGIRTDTQSIGEGGTIKVEADSLLIFGRADTGGSITVDSGITSNASPGSAGNAGDVMVTAHDLVVRGGGPRSVAGISSATAAGSSGNAGTVSVSGRSIALANGAKVSTENASRGTGGPVRLNASDTLTMDHAEILARTTTEEGGDVTLAVGRLFDLHDSDVTTSIAGGTGSGGDITIKSFLMVVDGSDIVARAQKGHGGSIKIEAGQFIQTPDATINASSAESISGTITIAAPNIDIAGSLVVLPETFLDASSQLRETCAARGGRPASSFTAGGRGGLPPDPSAPLAASLFGPPLEQQTATRSAPATAARAPQAAKPITVSEIPQPVLGSPRLTCRG
jgi:large exoprotein involved in heme utilization and adhesion